MDMSNGDMPITAIEINGFGQFAPSVELGLTKREHFAGLAMQGYLSGIMAWTDGLDGVGVSPSGEEVAAEAVSYADALLKELDKE